MFLLNMPSLSSHKFPDKEKGGKAPAGEGFKEGDQISPFKTITLRQKPDL